jgi:glutamine synthetase
VNLLDPGDTPNKNVQFLFVLACILKAVDTHADLLRQSAADVGNDHRLGANEAPPAIISVFLGEQLEDVVKQLIETGVAKSSKRGGKLKTGVSTLPQFEKDATDRNRTSPFAFTGNKFEFRMVGSSDSMASSNTTLNTIVAEAFCEAADILEKADDFDMAVHDLIKEYLTDHQRIIFNGDGYSDEWVEEAERRGLPNIKSTIEAADALTSKKSIDLFGAFGVYTKTELESRKEIIFENYAKTINIEALTMIDMASKQIIPAVMKYAGRLAKDVNEIKQAGADESALLDELKEITTELTRMKNALDELKINENKARSIRDERELAYFYKDVVRPSMDALRDPADKLEMLVDKKDWPFPTYADLLFEG